MPHVDKSGHHPEDQSWLHNPSFVQPTCSDAAEISESSSSDEYTLTPAPKKTKNVTTKVEPSGEKDLYKIDRQADVENLHYDSVYSGSVAVYRRRFDCLGLKANQKVKWTDGRSKHYQKKKQLKSDMRYFTENFKYSPSELAIPRVAKKGGVRSLSDFIKIETDPTAFMSDGSAGPWTADRHMSQLTGEYNRSLLEHPHDVELWLEFLVLQDQLLEWGHLPGEASSNVTHKNRALLERKIAIFERALEHNPTSEKLLVGHMSLVQEVWATEKIVRKWKDIVFIQPNQPLLWLSYIHFCQTNFSTFSTSSVITLYKKCITTLSSICQGTLKSHHPLPNTPSYLLAIFSRFCNFLQEVGLSERAVTCYQALLEYNLCTPSDFTEDKSLKEFFETFWDSGSPRYGEPEALGWCNWMKKTTGRSADVKALGLLPHAVVCTSDAECTTESGDDEATELSVISGLPLTEAWLKLEDHRMIKNCFPWKPDVLPGQSEEDCSDPDRMVTFDDVSQTLFLITDPELKLKLVLSFLSFLGAPVQLPFQSLVGVTSNIQSLHDISPLPYLDEGIGSENVACGLGCAFSMSSETSLAEFAEFFSKQVVSEGARPPARTPAVCNFISNVCNHSLSLLPSLEHQTGIAKVWLSFLFQQLINDSRSSVSKKDVKAEIRLIQKLFKSLLRLDQHRNNLTLWNCYPLFEFSVGNFKEAKSLYQSILAQQPVPSASLCCTLCECYMGLRRTLWQEVDKDTQLALHALVCLAEGKNSPVEMGGACVSPGRILKARSHFVSHIDAVVSGERELANVVLCCSYFEYLVRGVKEACLVFDKWIDALKQHVEKDQDEVRQTDLLRVLKHVYLKQLQLLENHSLHHPIQPFILRRAIERALESFPNEGRLMAAFITSERQTFISGRMRRHFDRICPAAKTPIPWLFAVAAELDRYFRVTGQLGEGGGTEETSVGTVHRVRSILDRAAAAGNARHCVLLWRIYLAVQVSRCNSD